MMRLSATDILRRHVQERHLRAAVRAIDIEREPSAVPLMSQEAWVDSMGLVAGVDERVLRMLAFHYCGEGETRFETVLVEVQGEDVEVRDEQVCVPLKLALAAELAGLGPMDHKAARALHRQAIAVVEENLVRRASREEEP